jgi:hypothetical protein
MQVSTNPVLPVDGKPRPAAVWLFEDGQLDEMLDLYDRTADFFGEWTGAEHWGSSDRKRADLLIDLGNGQTLGLCLTTSEPEEPKPAPAPRLVLQPAAVEAS